MADETPKKEFPPADPGSGEASPEFENRADSEVQRPPSDESNATADQQTETAPPPSGAEASPGPSDTERSQLVYCARCGAVMAAKDRFCHACGWEVGTTMHVSAPPKVIVNPSDRKRLTALLLCILLGPFGAHRFYVGKVGTGLIWLFTLGFLGIGVVYDLIFIATGEFRDDRERRVVHWD